MMGMLAAYWHKDGLDVYRYVDKKPVKQASGRLDGLKPIKGILDKKALIVGRELLLHTRKRYPPAPIKKLTQAVEMEVKDLFPISKPAFCCRVFESSTAHTTLDIWAWESEPYAQVQKIFPFNYVVPEDIAYSSEVPEVKVFQYRGMTHVLAHSGRRFIGGTSAPEAGMDEKEMERFLSGLGRYRSDIKQIRIYGPVPVQFKDGGISNLLRVAQEDHPPCLDHLAGLNLHEFKAKGEIHLSSKIDLLCRILIYLILGYGLMLYLTARNYDRVALEIREKIGSIDKKISSKMDAGKGVEDYSDIVKEVNEKIRARPSPLKVMEMLAKRLPADSFINRTVLDESNLEISVSSKDPLSVIKTLGSAEGVKTARLRGVPIKDSLTGSCNFIVHVELSR